MKKVFANAYIWILMLLLYAPILLILVFSFTEAKVLGTWTGFSTNLYRNLLMGEAGEALNNAIYNTVLIALTFAAIGIHNMRHGRVRQAITFTNNIPMINPDIITGISIFLLFVFLGIGRGLFCVICAHIAFCTPYVVLNVMPQLMKMNPNLYEAALDLGATPMQALRKVIIPELKSGMISGFILAITLSVDDFAVTLFTKGSGTVETLSTYIYADARKGGLTPELRPLFSIIFLVILVLLVFYNLKTAKQTSNN